MEYIHSIAISVIMLLGAVITLWVYISNKSSRLNQLFLLLVTFPALNVLFSYISDIDLTRALVWSRLAWLMGSLAIMIFYFFIVYFPRKIKSFPVLNGIVILVWSTFSYISMFTNYIVADAKVENSVVNISPGILMNLFYVSAVTFIILPFFILFNKYHLLNKLEKRSIKYFFIGLLSFILLSTIFSIVLPGLFGIQNLTDIGDYSIILFIGLAGYSIVKNGLFDVKLAIVRSVTYSLVLLTLAGIYLAIAYVISAVFNTGQTNTGQLFSGVAISLLLAFIFQPIKRFFDKVTNRIFYKDNYNTDDFFAQLNKALSVTTDLRALLERVGYIIGTTLKAEQAFFYIYTNDGHFITAGTPKHSKLPKHDADHIGIPKTEEDHGVVVASFLDEKDPIRRLMISHRLELVLPLVQDDDLIGYLCMGDHLTSGYTNRDLRVLNTIRNELIIAIQNALAVHEIQEINESLKQRIANATKELRSSNAVLRQLDKIKDEFISMASHQLRTPLTSVKGYISMILEGDAGKISETQKKFLGEAFMSSEKMVHLINDFLNVSRIQTGKFIIDKTSVDLSKLVQEEVDQLRPNGSPRNITFKYKAPKDFPKLNLDEGKMRQVVMNFADNAIYYSHENSSINVNLSVENGEVLFTVKDTGIGVPVNEREKLFSKFYRASNARVQRPDGTGVGIYLAKKVIDAHDGEIVFESVEGKGSTFGFRLPIKN